MSRISSDIIRAKTEALETPTIYPVRGSAKAWSSFSATPTLILYHSLNIAALTDISVGQEQVSFTAQFSANNPSASVTPRGGGFMGGVDHTQNTATICRMSCVSDVGTYTDSNIMMSHHMGNLA